MTQDTRSDTPESVWVIYAPNGNIRKWDFRPFSIDGVPASQRRIAALLRALPLSDGQSLQSHDCNWSVPVSSVETDPSDWPERVTVWSDDPDWDGQQGVAYVRADLAAALPRDEGPGGGVRPLEWRGPFCGFYEADTWGGVIKIMQDFNPICFILNPGNGDRQKFPTLDAAKAKAQAEHEARVRSCLLPAPYDHARAATTFWLIERPSWIGGRPHWWHPSRGWVPDVNDAIQFARQQDAEDIRKATCTDNEVVTEHMWMGRPTPDGHAWAVLKAAAAYHAAWTAPEIVSWRIRETRNALFAALANPEEPADAR